MIHSLKLRILCVWFFLLFTTTTNYVLAQSNGEFNRILTLQAKSNEKHLPQVAGNDKYLATTVIKYNEDGNPKSQSVYIYEKEENSWKFSQEIYHSNDMFYQYGLHLAFWGNLLLVSCQACESYLNPKNPKTNKILVYKKTDVWKVIDELDFRNTFFNHIQLLQANNYLFISDAENSFGTSLSGAVYCYYRLGDRVGSKAFMVSPNRKIKGYFGYSIAANQKDLFISQSGTWFSPDSGLVYRFDLNNIQGRNEPMEIIRSSVYAGRDGFGLFMTGNDSLVAISSPNHYKVRDEGTDKIQILEYPHVQLFKKKNGRYNSEMIINGPKDSEYTFGVKTNFDNNHVYVMRKWQLPGVYFGRHYDFDFDNSEYKYNKVFRLEGSFSDTAITMFKGGNSIFAVNYLSDNTQLLVYQKKLHDLPIISHYSANNLSVYTKISSGNDGVFKLATDGSESSMFKVDLDKVDSNYVLQIAENGLGEDTVSYGKFSLMKLDGRSMYFKYRHPDVFTKPFQYKDTLELELRHKRDHRIVPIGIIEVYRPPVLLVHGIWSSEKAFEALELNLIDSKGYKKFQLYKLDYYKSHAAAFPTNVHLIPRYLDRLKRIYQDSGIVCKKVSVVGHSMGGILTRLYLQSLSYKDDIGRFIGFNVPHAGTAMANYITESPNLAFLLNLFGRKTNQGAVNNLRVDSELIKYILNGSMKNRNIIPSHTIVTRIIPFPIGGDPSDWPKRSVLSEILTDSWVSRIHNNMESDEVVVTASQAGGIKKEAMTIIDDEVHTGSTENQVAITKVLRLLDLPSETSEFSRFGFDPPILQYSYGRVDLEIRQRSASLSESPVIRLINQETTYTIEDSLDFMVNKPARYKRISLVFQTPDGKISAISTLKSEDTLHWQSPHKVPGYIKVFIFTSTDKDPLAHIDSINNIFLQPTNTFIELVCDKTEFEAIQGESSNIQVKGMDDSGKFLDLTYMADLKMISYNGLAKWQNGFLLHKEFGIDTIFFQYHNLITKKIVVSTLPSYANPSITVTKDPDCNNTTLHISKCIGLVPPYRYLWNTGDTTAYIRNVHRGYYSVLVTDSVFKEAESGIMVELGKEVWENLDTIIKKGNFLSAPAIPKANYRWSTHDTTSFIKIASQGKYILTIISSVGCSVTDTIHVYTSAPTMVVFNHPSFYIIKQKDQSWIISPKNKGYKIESAVLIDNKIKLIDENKWLFEKKSNSLKINNNGLSKGNYMLEIRSRRFLNFTNDYIRILFD